MLLAVIADIHCGPDQASLPGSGAPALLDRFVERMRERRPACIVDLGDRINSVAAGQDRIRERYVRRRLEDAGVPVYCVLGNTDVERLTKAEALAAAGRTSAAELIDVGEGDLALVLLDTVDPAVDGVGGAISAAQLNWLRAILAASRAPCLVFGHHPLHDPDVEGHRYFAGRPALAAVTNRLDAVATLQATSAVLAVFAGHVHRSHAVRVGSIPHVTIGSFIDTAYSGGQPAETYALVNVGPQALDVTVEGSLPARFTFPR